MLPKASDHRKADRPIHPIFIERWAPRAMTGEEVSEASIIAMFEAARWAPSSFNHQPWRFLYAHRIDADWPLFLEPLVASNRKWAVNAAVMIVMMSDADRKGEFARTHSFDTGAAWQNLALQGALLGLSVRGIEGFDYDLLRQSLGIPPRLKIEAMAAIGVPDVRDTATPSARRPVQEWIHRGAYRKP